ncbi:hypothetical protein LM701042_60228 [Listeria monocytogenes]|nr:hypothetical protein LM600444_60228 [Listeria monocytogenes]CUK97907.1 hypothetical protein LM701042_60228 [Listeria monocytogenes]
MTNTEIPYRSIAPRAAPNPTSTKLTNTMLTSIQKLIAKHPPKLHHNKPTNETS